MNRTLTALAALALTVTTVGCATTPTVTLSPADAAACAQLDQVLVDFEAGYNATEAFARNAEGGWPEGMPSDQVRGVFNLYRRWVAVERDEKLGFATYDDSVDALGEALRAQKNVCGR